jgi:hypothetical protein
MVCQKETAMGRKRDFPWDWMKDNLRDLLTALLKELKMELQLDRS